MNDLRELMLNMLFLKQVEAADEGAMMCHILAQRVVQRDAPLRQCRELLDAKNITNITPEVLLGRMKIAAAAEATAYVNRADGTMHYLNLLKEGCYASVDIPEHLRGGIYAMMDSEGMPDVSGQINATLDKIAKAVH